MNPRIRDGCPIKHARRVLHAHPCYDPFADFAEAEACRGELQALREALARLERASGD